VRPQVDRRAIRNECVPVRRGRMQPCTTRSGSSGRDTPPT
jgi:hypothetical protein